MYYPITNLYVIKKLSDSYKAFKSRIDDLFIPKNIHEVLDHPNWKSEVYGKDEFSKTKLNLGNSRVA